MKKVAFVCMNNVFDQVIRGGGYVASAVINAGHHLDFFNTAYVPVPSVAANILQGGYDIVMISTMSFLFKESMKLTRLLRESSDIPVLVGGIHATVAGASMLEENPEIDFGCVGEGEQLAVELLDNLGKESVYDLPNLIYRKDGQVHVNKPRPAVDLETLPPFLWSLFPYEAVIQEMRGIATIHATRGCPFSCTYCCNTVNLKIYGKNFLRKRPIDDVIDELLYLKYVYRPQLYYIADEMVLFDEEYAATLFEEIKKRVGLPWGANARVEALKPPMVKLMEDTGCVYLTMGVEAGNEQFRRKYLNRHMTDKQLEDAFRLTDEAGMFRTAYNLIGLPFENHMEIMEETIEFNRKIKPDHAHFFIYYPFIGTKLYDITMEQGLFDPEKDTTHYDNDSNLKGYSLQARRLELHAEFQPSGIGFQFKKGEEKGIYAWQTRRPNHCDAHYSPRRYYFDFAELLEELPKGDIVIWGQGGRYQEKFAPLLEEFKDRLNVVGFVDNDEATWGSEFAGFPVFSPAEAAQKDITTVFIASSWWEGIKQQIYNLGMLGVNVVF